MYIVCFTPDTALSEQLFSELSKVWQDATIEIARDLEGAYRITDQLAFDNKEIVLAIIDSALLTKTQETLLDKLYNRWPNAVRVIITDAQNHLAKDLIQRTKPFNVFFKPLSEIQTYLLANESRAYWEKQRSLQEKTRVLTELNRASLSLIGEINLDKLLHKLMRIILDNSGALNAYIVLEEQGEFVIRAEGHQGSYQTNLERQLVSDFSPVCPAIIEYAAKRKTIVLLKDAINEGLFKHHPYVRKHLCRSILCVPLIYQGKLFGLLYIDHPGKPNAFSTQSIELLQLISAPAAIAIQNALIYQHLEQLVEERTKEIQEQKALLEEKNRELKEKNEDILASLRYAKRIQEAYLPSPEVLKECFPDSFLYYKPKAIVSGDFYWFSPRLSKVIVAVADCTGHGIPGGFITAMANTLLKQIVEIEGIFKPHEILFQLHVRMRAALQQHGNKTSRDGLEIALCQIDVRRKKLLFSGANRPLIYIRNNTLHELKPDKYGVGGQQFEDERTYTLHSLQMQEGDVLYLFSDGFQDQIGGPNNKRYKTDRFYDLLLELHARDMEQQKLLLDSELRHWMGDNEQTDDITVIGIRL